MNIVGRSYMRITSENESEQGNLTIRERERGGGEEEVHVQAGEALFIQNVCRY